MVILVPNYKCSNIVKFKHIKQQIFHFDALKEQVISRTRKINSKNLVLHKRETLMTRNYFRIGVKLILEKRCECPMIRE